MSNDIQPQQLRAARAWLGWSQEQAALNAGVSVSTIRDFEAGRRTPVKNNLAAIRRAVADAGVIPMFSTGGDVAIGIVVL